MASGSRYYISKVTRSPAGVCPAGVCRVYGWVMQLASELIKTLQSDHIPPYFADLAYYARPRLPNRFALQIARSARKHGRRSKAIRGLWEEKFSPLKPRNRGVRETRGHELLYLQSWHKLLILIEVGPGGADQNKVSGNLSKVVSIESYDEADQFGTKINSMWCNFF
jgi:hypothetical protein